MKKSQKILLTAALSTASVVMAGLYVYCKFLLAPPLVAAVGHLPQH